MAAAFSEFLKTSGLFEAWVSECPLELQEPPVDSIARRRNIAARLLAAGRYIV